MTRGRWGQGTPLVIIEAWSTPSLGTTVMPRDVEVPPPWDCLRGTLHVLSLKTAWLVSDWRALGPKKLTETIKVAMI